MKDVVTGQQPGMAEVSAPASDPWRTAFHHAPMGIAVASADGVLAYVNRAFGRLLGQRPDDLCGRALLDFTPEPDLAGARAACAAVRRGRPARWGHECRLVHRDGRFVHVQVTTSWVDTAPPQLVMVVEDITERKAVEAGLEHRALHDPLTGLPNRRLFEDRLRHAIDRGVREGTSTCLLVIDLDGFKSVNDQHGHLVGDRVLLGFASRLSSVIRASDTAARLGGDEFAVVCEGRGPTEAEAILARLRHALAAPLSPDAGVDVHVRFSAGVVRAPSGMTADEAYSWMLQEADNRMYVEKAESRTSSRAGR
jgi:diguanylate cyclase (GGDEF)-like protein/PAS domain S-box-containing protein